MNNISLEELENARKSLENRIKALEADLHVPLDADFHEQASQLSQQLIVRRLLEAEQSYLEKVNQQITQLKLNTLV